MKKAIILIFLAIGATQAANLILKPAKQELPEVIITQHTIPPEETPKVYSTKFSVEFCPRENTNYKADYVTYDNAEGTTVFVTHCKECNLGVYSEHDNESGRRCTYCKAREVTYAED